MNWSNCESTKRYGRWGSIEGWWEETRTITEEPVPAALPQTFPVPDRWALAVHIQQNQDGDFNYTDSMKTGMEMLAAVGTRPVDAYLEHGRCVIWLKSADFYEAKGIAERVKDWLTNQGVNTAVGNYLYPEPKKGNWAYLSFLRVEDNIPIPGKWLLTVMLPEGSNKDKSRVASMGRDLATDLGLTANDSGSRVGGWLLDFEVGDFTTAKTKAKETIQWLREKGNCQVTTSWGDADLPLESLDEESVRSLNETGYGFYASDDFTCARIKLRDLNDPPEDEWTGRLKRLLTRLAGSTEELAVTLTCAQVETLLDLVADCVLHYERFEGWMQSEIQGDSHVSEKQLVKYKDVPKVLGPLYEILGELRTTLRRRTARGRCSNAL